MRIGFNRIIRAERGAPPCGIWLELAGVAEQVYLYQGIDSLGSSVFGDDVNMSSRLVPIQRSSDGVSLLTSEKVCLPRRTQ